MNGENLNKKKGPNLLQKTLGAIGFGAIVATTSVGGGAEAASAQHVTTEREGIHNLQMEQDRLLRSRKEKDASHIKLEKSLTSMLSMKTGFRVEVELEPYVSGELFANISYTVKDSNGKEKTGAMKIDLQRIMAAVAARMEYHLELQDDKRPDASYQKTFEEELEQMVFEAFLLSEEMRTMVPKIQKKKEEVPIPQDKDVSKIPMS